MEDLIIAGSLRCPSCGAVQPEDRPVCLECGMHFTAKIQILAARRPLGLPDIFLVVHVHFFGLVRFCLLQSL